VVIGGGDTGSDCVGTSNRQGAAKVYQFEILPQPPEQRPDETPWPTWPKILRTSSSHKEGCVRKWCIATKRLTGEDNRVKHLYGVEVEWVNDGGRWKMSEKKGTEFTMDVDLVLLAMGFVHVVHRGVIEELGLALDPRGNVVGEGYRTSQPGVFVAGDAHTGASLVVRAIRHGRDAADAVDAYLREA
jgi:glutamate synthase (NADPH/NADH) small chain